jgi:hypothetical protein
MKTLFSFLFLFLGIMLQAQSDYLRVYNIMQDNCASCHNPTDAQGGLDLVGSGSSAYQKQLDVYSNLVNATPVNAVAAAKGYKIVSKGRADKSFLFHKVNQGLDPYYSLDAGMGDGMPNVYPNQIAYEDQEVIRQWILYGASPVTSNIDSVALAMYFAGQGTNAFENAPVKPEASEGFQIKMGPFYLPPGGEVEYYQKWATDLAQDLEVNRLDMRLSGYSHHFIAYHFTSDAAANAIQDGLRLNAYHNDIAMTTAVQEQTDLVLPENTAFFWEAGRVLDLNTHYINYNQSSAYRCEVYVNIYTQPSGTAQQQMYSTLLVNNNINIENTGDPIVESQLVSIPDMGSIWIWGLMGHTHRYGTDYDIYRATEAGTAGEKLYDASCPQGNATCSAPYYDYQHIPLKYYEPLLEMNMDLGIYHEATWVNDGPVDLSFGPTSDDEMMVAMVMFTLDTAGLATGVKEIMLNTESMVVKPNPTSTFLGLALPETVQQVSYQIYNNAGALLSQKTQPATDKIATDHLATGSYLIHCQDVATGRRYVAQFVKI